MSQQILYTILLAAAFLLLFALAELLYHVMKIKAELTRKLVHFGTGLLTLLFPLLLDNHWLVLILCSSFLILLLLSLKFNLLRSVNAVDRRSYGSLLYPVSVYTCYVVFEMRHYHFVYFYLPILILAVCDPVAALVGKRWPYGKYKVGSGHKTIIGSLAFFISATLIGLFLLHGSSFAVPAALIFAAGATLAEAVSRNGFDNLFIPLSVLSCMMLLLN